MTLSRWKAWTCLESTRYLVKHSCYHFPTKHSSTAPPHHHSQVQEVVHRRWRHLREATRPRVATFGGVFQAWRHFCRFRALRKLANRASRFARQQKHDDLLAQAERHAKQYNMHQLYKIIRLLAPKQRYRKVQLYGKDGQMLSRDQEVEEFRTHYSKVFQGNALDAVIQTRGLPCPIHRRKRFKRLSIKFLRNKATPPHMAPGPVWSAAGYGLSLLVARELPKLCAHPLPRVPQSWKDGWMALFCKPNKPGRRPEDYRPICLQDPMGKAMLSLLAGRIKPLVQGVCRRPAHSMLTCRDAPRKERCSGSSTSADSFEISRTALAGPYMTKDISQRSRTPSPGAWFCPWDMSHAFDSVPRQYLQAALLDAGVARADVQLIMQWLQGSEYHMQHGRINLSILTHRGVRQGCVLSPLLWSCFTCYVAKRLPQTLKKQDLQMYADDFLMYWIFRSRADFHHALSSIPVFLAALRTFGLTINLSKTAALIRMAHSQGQVELRKHVVSNHKGTFLCLFGPQTELVPLVKQHKYLGCIISLFDFEVLTIRHRIEVGRNQFLQAEEDTHVT